MRTHLLYLTRYYSKAQLNVVECRVKFEALQSSLPLDPLNVHLFQELSTAKICYGKWMRIEEHMLQQRSKWLHCGDSNTIFFMLAQNLTRLLASLLLIMRLVSF